MQRAPVATSFGTFSDEIYAPIEQQGKKVGVEMALAFAPGTAADPGDKVEATKIGLVQSVKSVEGGATTLMNPGDAGKSVTGGAADGRQIDRLYGNNNPVYGADRLPDGKGLDATPESNAPQGEAAVVGGAKQNASYVLGHRTKDGAGWKAAPAKLSDKPKLPPGAPSSSQVFETTALALEGKDKDKYYGSVSWGWKTEADGKFTQLPLTKVSDGKPSEGFTEPAKQWNQYQVAAKINPPDGSGNTTTKTDLEVETSSRSFTIAAGSKLTVDLTGKSISGTMLVTLADPVQVVDGGMQWWSWIATAKVKDGAVTEDLNLKAHDAPYTLAKGSKVVEVGSSEIGGERLYKLGAAIVRGAAIGPRIVWVRDAELKGDKTVALPIPT